MKLFSIYALMLSIALPVSALEVGIIGLDLSLFEFYQEIREKTQAEELAWKKIKIERENTPQVLKKKLSDLQKKNSEMQLQLDGLKKSFNEVSSLEQKKQQLEKDLVSQKQYLDLRNQDLNTYTISIQIINARIDHLKEELLLKENQSELFKSINSAMKLRSQPFSDQVILNIITLVDKEALKLSALSPSDLTKKNATKIEKVVRDSEAIIKGTSSNLGREIQNIMQSETAAQNELKTTNAQKLNLDKVVAGMEENIAKLEAEIALFGNQIPLKLDSKNLAKQIKSLENKIFRNKQESDLIQLKLSGKNVIDTLPTVAKPGSVILGLPELGEEEEEKDDTWDE